MYRIKKTLEISAAHKLDLPYESKCSKNHGHNWIITIICESKKLTNYGMVTDFAEIKRIIMGALDHNNLNDIIPQPTAENIAKWIHDLIPSCVEVRVKESEGNEAAYIQD